MRSLCVKAGAWTAVSLCGGRGLDCGPPLRGPRPGLRFLCVGAEVLIVVPLCGDRGLDRGPWERFAPTLLHVCRKRRLTEVDEGVCGEVNNY